MKSQKQDIAVFSTAVLALAGIWLIDKLLPADITIPSLYAIPILILASRYKAKEIGWFSVVTIMVYSLQAELEHYSRINIILHDVGLVIISLLTAQLGLRKLRAETAEKQLEFYVNIVAHDLMQPVAIIKLSAGLLAKKINSSQKVLSTNLISATATIEQLAADLRDTAQIKSAKFNLHKSQVDLKKLLEEVVAQEQITTVKHRIILDCPPEAAGVGDKERLKQVFTNLLSNSIKYSPDGGKIKVTVQKQTSLITVAVTDEGIGMSKTQCEALFQPFVRQYNGKKNIKGTGLGLYISKAIVEGHQGTIKVDSQPDKGSTFRVVLPTKNDY